jgi:glycosyltransferase involved in cell wall biosynthesis
MMNVVSRPGVLMISGAYFPELSGGSLPIRAIVRQLHDAARFAVLTTTADRALPGDDERDGVPVYRVFVDPARLWSKVVAALRMLRVFLIERRRFSILHLHGFSEKTILLMALALLVRKRIAITLTSVGHDDPASIRSRGWFSYWWYSRAHVFVGVSPRFAEIYEASGLPKDRFRLIPYGVDLERFRPASDEERAALRREIGVAPEAVMILFVAFFSREKCPDVLFEAWARLAAEGDASSVLVFVGATRSSYHEVDETLAEGIRRDAERMGLTGRIHFVEPTREIEKYHRAADIFVLPSVREGLPNVVLEAMACGVACVVTRLPGVSDLLIDDGTSGLLVPGRDVAALQAALARLVAQPELAKAMGERARAYVAREFSVMTMGQRYLETYRSLLTS